MKKIKKIVNLRSVLLLSAAILAVSITAVWADWVDGTLQNIWSDNTSRNVGIGTDSPKVKLDVKGTIRSNTDHSIFEYKNRWFSINTLDAGYAHLCWFGYPIRNPDSSRGWISTHDIIRTSAILSGNNGFKFILSNTLPGSGETIPDMGTKMIIKPNGNVGIGTDDPRAKLQVMRFKAGSHSVIDNGYLTAYSGFGIGWNGEHWSTSGDGSHNGSALIAARIGNGDLNFYTFPSNGVDDHNYTDLDINNYTKMTITGTGNVGIGTTNPRYDLDISKPIHNGFSVGMGGDNGRIWTEYLSAGPNLIFYDQDDFGGIIRFRESPTTYDENEPEFESFITGIRGKIGVNTMSPKASMEVGGFQTHKDSSDDEYKVSCILSGAYDRWVHFGGLTSGRIRGSNEGYLALESFRTGTNNRLYLNLNSDGDIMIAHGGGNVSIGAGTSPSYKLEVQGDVAATGFTCDSDIRYKKDINTYEKALNKIIRLNGVTFNWKTKEFKDKNYTKERQIGLIAQEVEEVIPEIVRTDKQGYKSVTYNKLTAVLVEAVKELKAENDRLTKRVNKLERLNKRIAALERVEKKL